jgi:aminoglycoside 6'-N-acetyltransferase
MEISFRPLTKDDIPMFKGWLEAAHVREWWRDDVEETLAEYRQELEEGSTTSFFVMLADGRPVGFIQSYRVADEPEYLAEVKFDDAVAIDLLIGEPDLVGKGAGPRIIAAFVEQVVKPTYPDAKFALASPSVHNARSIRAFEKAGFEKRHVAHFESEPDPEQVMVLTL